MKKLLLFLSILSLYSKARAQYPLIQWAQKLQATSANSSAPYSDIAESIIDNVGNIYVVGGFADTLHPDPSSTNLKLVANPNDGDAVFFAKYNPAGGLIWAKAVGTGYGLDIALDRLGNIYVTGYGNSTDSADFDPGPAKVIHTSGTDFMFICKYDNNGNYLNARFFNGVGIKGLGIATDSLLNIYVSGCVRNTVDFDPGPGVTNLTRHNTVVNRDGFYAKYDSSMNLLWARLDIQTRDCEDIAVNDASGRILVASQALRLVDFNGITTDSLITNIKGTNAVRFDDSGNMYFSGYFSDSNINFNWNGTNTLSTTGPNDENGFLVKYNSAKVFQWAHKYKIYFDMLSTRVSTLNGNVLLAYYESDGIVPHKGFLKVNPINGNVVGLAADFVTHAGGIRSSTAIYSATDNSILFASSAGGGNYMYDLDVNPDTAVSAIQNISGQGYWGYMAKYSNCTSAPATPGTITGNTALCGTGTQIYSIMPVTGATKYNWVLPNGWTGTSDSSKIIVQPGVSGGTISVTAENVCGISPARTINVTYNEVPVVSISASNMAVCAGEQVTLSGNGATSYSWSNGVIDNVPFTPTNTTTYHVSGTSNGCIDVDSVTVVVKQPNASIINAAICNGETYTFNGLNLGATGTYYDTLINAAGCDSVVTLTLIVYQQSTSSFSVPICTGQSYSFNGNTLTASGVYYDTLQNATGCDSVIMLTLIVKQNTSSTLSVVICQGDSYFFNGVNLTTQGIYSDTLLSADGCDSILTLTLSVIPNLYTSVQASICAGTYYQFGNIQLNQTGIYTDTLPAFNTCDSIVTLYLQVDSIRTTTINAVICEGSSYSFNGQLLTQSGTYLDTLQTASGCDSLLTLNLNVYDYVTSSISALVCQGEIYNFNGLELTEAGNYSDTLSSSGGCDSIIILTLNVAALPQPTITQSGNTLSTQVYDTYQWLLNGDTISGANAQVYTATESGTYAVKVTAQGTACEGISAALNVTVVGMKDIPLIGLSLYPNPATNILMLQCEEPIANISIYNMLSQLVYTQGYTTNLNIAALPQGMYILKVSTINGTTAHKQFVKE